MGPSIPEPDPSAEVIDLVGSVARRVRLAANRDLGPLGVTWAQVRALRVLARCDGRVRMSELAERLGIARRSTTSVVDDLAARGLVERSGDPADRRAVEVEVSADGWRLLDELRTRRRAAAHELTAALSAAELATLRDLLTRLDPAP
jgi:DNA-binding MarR family transcriptional regulator